MFKYGFTFNAKKLFLRIVRALKFWVDGLFLQKSIQPKVGKNKAMNFAGRNWYYSYRELFSIGTEKKFNKASNDIASRYAMLTKSWNEDLNSQWTSRTYLSTKMILNATVLLKQREFAQESNLRVVVPYLEYYAILSLLRGVVFMLPDKDWEDGKLIEISHAKAISLTCDWIAKFDQEKAKEVKSFCNQLKAQRELISYKAPASGDANLGFDYDIDHFATLLAEVAQFNSELLESSVKKNTSKDDHVLLNKHAEQVCNIEIEGFEFHDGEDRHRMGYVRRKQPHPLNLELFMTEGQVEDFIGAWDADDYEDGSEEQMFYSGSPSSWQDIFDVP
ncbi:TPA: hypothetical protein ACVU4V_004523 [Vibrio parahaemolyticus]